MKNLVKMVVLFTIITLGGSCFAQCDLRCQAAFKFVVSHEDHNLSGITIVDINGGISRFGINSKAHPKAVHDGFYTMRKEKAIIYAQNLFYIGYWKAIHGDEIQNDKLSLRISDLAFNLGSIRAIILLQRALNTQGAYLVTKGYFGEDTLFYINLFSSEKTEKLLKIQARNFYLRLITKNPNMNTYKSVWLDRLEE